jgi:RHS repeat-associated protein
MDDGSGGTDWTYDSLGRVITETKAISNTGTFVTGWGYNSAGLASWMKYPGGNSGEKVAFSYHSQMSLNRIYSQDNSTYYLQATEYDAAGRISWRALGANNLAENPKLTNAYSYYAWSSQGGRLQSLKTYTTTIILQDLSYTYDNMGNVLTILDAQNSNQKQCFTYDSLNRLTKGTTSNDSTKGCTTQLGNGNYSEDYTYDSATGNLLSKTNIGIYTYSTSHSHAVISTSANSWSFTYDSNGNMTQRNLNGTIYNYSYNAENKLTDVSGGTTASFTYDGNGNRVKTVVGGTTTVFLGNYYEWTSSTVKKYYFAGTTRIAMRENSTLIFLSSDHLGSTSLVYKTDTGLIIKKLYKPWGETRYTSTAMPTRFQFTGQYREVSLGGADGLYYFVARWYDQALGRFMQADTIVPKPEDIQAWDRYAYANHNPIKYSDPSGHCPFCLIIAGFLLIGTALSVDQINIGVEQMQWASQQPTFPQEQAAVQQWQDNCMGQCHYSQAVAPAPGITAGGPRPETPISDVYSEGLANVTQGAIGLAGSVSGLASVGRGALSSLSTESSVGKGVTILGRYPAYTNVANDVGGNVFSVSGEVFKKISPEINGHSISNSLMTQLLEVIRFTWQVNGQMQLLAHFIFRS